MRFPALGVRVAVEAIAPVAPVRAEGRVHLLYELRLTSFDPRVLQLESLEVLGDPAEHDRLARYEAAELGAMTESLSSTSAGPAGLAPGACAVVFLWIPLAPGVDTPGDLRHRFVFRVGSDSGSKSLSLDTKSIELSRIPPLVVDPPLREGPWLAHAGPAGSTHHRRILVTRNGMLTMDQRFATDWVLLERESDESGSSSFRPDWDRTTGSEVHAVEGGVVVAVVNDLPDDPDLDPEHRSPEAEDYRRWRERPLAIDWDTIGGNRVTVDMGDGRFAWYEHLRKGSVRVQVGDEIARGQVLGLVGSSGNAGAPHLHFEMTDSAVKGEGDGLPYVFRHFELLSRVDPLPDWDALVQQGPEELGMAEPGLTLRSAGDRDRTLEIPLGGSIVRFPTTED